MKGISVIGVAAQLVALGVCQAQQGGGPSAAMRQAMQLDRDGSTAQARTIIQSLIASNAMPDAKAQAQRAMAMSYAFDGDCANTVKYEEMVIAYWQTREQAEPQNAFYQEGEMANEGARVCLDAGDLNTAERMYRRGSELGLKEPEPKTHPKSLWDYRLAHALGRIAARRGDRAEAERQIAAARKALDGDSAMASQQERFFPYLVGYVALYTGNLKTAESEFTTMLAMRGWPVRIDISPKNAPSARSPIWLCRPVAGSFLKARTRPEVSVYRLPPGLPSRRMTPPLS